MNAGGNINGKSSLYDRFVVKEPAQLLDWLIANTHDSRTKVKAILHGQGVKVNGKVVTQFNFQLEPGMKVAVSKTKNNQLFKNHYLKVVYEDRYIVVIDKKPGVLSMAAGHSSLNVKSILDDYFRQSRQRPAAPEWWEGSGDST